MSKRKKKKELRQEESIIGSSEALQEKVMDAEAYIEKYQKQILIVVGVLVLAVTGFYGYKYLNNQKNKEAQAEMFKAQSFFAADSLDLALNGREGGDYGFLDIIKKFDGTKASNLSNFYVGAIYLKKESYDQALQYLEAFSSDDINVQSQAYALMGDAYSQKGEYAKAASKYEEAATNHENKFMSPIYFMKAVNTYEIAGDKNKAVAICKNVVLKYPNASEINDFKKKLAALSGEVIL